MHYMYCTEGYIWYSPYSRYDLDHCLLMVIAINGTWTTSVGWLSYMYIHYHFLPYCVYDVIWSYNTYGTLMFAFNPNTRLFICLYFFYFPLTTVCNINNKHSHPINVYIGGLLSHYTIIPCTVGFMLLSVACTCNHLCVCTCMLQSFSTFTSSISVLYMASYILLHLHELICN